MIGPRNSLERVKAAFKPRVAASSGTMILPFVIAAAVPVYVAMQRQWAWREACAYPIESAAGSAAGSAAERLVLTLSFFFCR